MTQNLKCQLFEDVFNAVYEDSYIFMSIWGPPRSSKTSLAMWLSYSIYKDWGKVLQSLAFSLPQVLHRIVGGIPERFPTRNGLHMRVPILVWDDYGSFSNKAITQHELAWDTFKGAFDTLGTKLAVLACTMVDPKSATQQLQDKFTAECAVFKKGEYKYDRCQWQQDFHGWSTRVKKVFVETNVFAPIPIEVYREYDKMRQSLCDEILVAVNDTLTSTNIQTVMKLCKPEDLTVLKEIDMRGPLHQHSLDDWGAQGKLTLTRLKARGLVVPTPQGKGYYKMDLSPLGRNVLDKLAEDQKTPDSKIST